MKAKILGHVDDKDIVEVSVGDKVRDSFTGEIVEILDIMNPTQVRVNSQVNMGIRRGWEISSDKRSTNNEKE